MPIQIKYVNGKPQFRFGNSGKWYESRQQAEEQARAMYAAGYKEKKDEKK
jgi:hypothetical protein